MSSKIIVSPANLPQWRSGKVRDTASIPRHAGLLLPVFSDRLSTHNVVHESLVPGKGELLNAQSLFFAFKVFPAHIKTHLVAWGKDIYKYLPKDDYDPRLHYRAVVVKNKVITQKEFIYRSYLMGTLYYREYLNGRDPYGLRLPDYLPLMHRFKRPVFTPTMKSENDEPLPWRSVVDNSPVGCEVTRELYELGDSYLDKRGLALIDAKFEMSGRTVADEWFTGDCTRMALKEHVQDGVEPAWIGKEPFRKEAAILWDGGPKVPLVFPEVVIAEGIAQYHDGFERITGMTLAQFQKEYLD